MAKCKFTDDDSGDYLVQCLRCGNLMMSNTMQHEAGEPITPCCNAFSSHITGQLEGLSNIGDNNYFDPDGCPCGSGKKYKRCCGEE